MVAPARRLDAGEAAKRSGAGIGCSALQVYRDLLREGALDTIFIHLKAYRETLAKWMESRDHFLPSSLLDSQFATLEDLDPDERGFAVDSDDRAT